jgi:hypothetical protein
MSLGSALALVYWSLATFPAAGMAWVLMWFSDKLYATNIWWFGAVLRVITLIMQIGVLMAAIAMIVGVAYILGLNFYRAARGLGTEKDEPLKTRDYLLLFLLPVAMAASAILLALFNNWLDFNNHGLGLITMSYFALNWVLESGSIVVVFVWLIILPFFLHNRKKLLKLENLVNAPDYIVITCGGCFHQYNVEKGQGVITSKCPSCGRQARIMT